MRARVTFVSLAILIAAISSANAWSYSILYDSDSLRKTTTTKTFHHTFKDATRTRLKVSVELTAGDAVGTLTDPTGAVRWKRAFTTGRADLDEVFDGKQGEWTLRLSTKEATGRYSVTLKKD